MRILYISGYYKPAYVYGGPVRSISTLCEGLSKAGADITVFTTNANGHQRLDVRLEEEVVVDNVRVRDLNIEHLSNYFYSPELAYAIRTHMKGYDIVVVEALWGHAFHPTVKSCAANEIPFVVPLRGQLNPWAMRHGYIRKMIYLNLVARQYLNSASAIHCTDDLEYKAARRLGLRTPTFVLPNGIDTSRFRSMLTRGSIRNRFNIPEDAFVILFLGRLARIKRPDIAIKSLAAAKEKGINAHLIIAGPDEEGIARDLKSISEDHGCQNYVHMTGLLVGTEVLDAYTDSDIFIMPSEVQENFGMSALEAMAAGLPIVVSTGVPVGRWAEEAGAGIVLPATTKAFSQAICEILQQPEKLKRLGERGRQLAIDRFDVSIITRQFMEQLQAIIDTGKPLKVFN